MKCRNRFFSGCHDCIRASPDDLLGFGVKFVSAEGFLFVSQKKRQRWLPDKAAGNGDYYLGGLYAAAVI